MLFSVGGVVVKPMSFVYVGSVGVFLHAFDVCSVFCSIDFVYVMLPRLLQVFVTYLFCRCVSRDAGVWGFCVAQMVVVLAMISLLCL